MRCAVGTKAALPIQLGKILASSSRTSSGISDILLRYQVQLVVLVPVMK